MTVFSFPHLEERTRKGVTIFRPYVGIELQGAVSRIRSLEETEEFFYIPRRFDLEVYLKSGFGIEKDMDVTDVAIWFDPYQARWIREKRWDESEEKEEKDDGSLVLRMRVAVTGELRRWILSYGAHARVLEPEGLREEMKEEVQEMAKGYLG